jgi:phosphoglycerate dehydrogenase-like enzyme
MNLLLTGCFKYTSEQFDAIKSLGYQVYYMESEKFDELPLPAEQIDAVVCNYLFTAQDFGNFRNLKLIQLTSAGLDRVPVEQIRSKGCKLFNARGVYSIPMAEWAVGRILEHYKHFNKFNSVQQNREWIKDRDIKEIIGTKTAIIGAGNIGQEVAKRLSAFGSEVTGYDVVLGERPYFDKIMHINALSSEVGDYDIVVLTAPYTKETHHLLSSEILNSLRKDAILVNIARGGLIDTKALINVLTERTDLFAALDVFEEEPLTKENVIWSLSNVAVSPHNSFVSNGNNNRMFSVIYSNLKEFIR